MSDNINLTDPIFHDEDAARAHFEAQRWPTGPYCPHCGSVAVIRMQGTKHRAGALNCRDCRKAFTATVGTVFESSKVPLHKWMLATHLMNASKKGISAHQLHRTLGVTYKTAWFMEHRLREAMRDVNPGPLGGDEAPPKPLLYRLALPRDLGQHYHPSNDKLPPPPRPSSASRRRTALGKAGIQD